MGLVGGVEPSDEVIPQGIYETIGQLVVLTSSDTIALLCGGSGSCQGLFTSELKPHIHKKAKE